MNKIAKSLKTWNRIKKEKIIKNSDGIGMINFRAEITANNIIKICKELMNSKFLYIIAESEGEVFIRKKWIEYQCGKNTNVEEKVNKIYLHIKEEELLEAINYLIKSDVNTIIIGNSNIENDFFTQFIQNMCDSRKCIKDGIINAMLYLDLEEHPFDILYAYNLKQEFPSLKGEYYELPFEFE